jgi:hypothetical protein
MSAVHLIRTAPAPAGPAPDVPPVRHLQPVQEPVTEAIAGPPGESADSSPLTIRAADEKREVCAIARGTVQAAIEVLAGTRPIHQLARRLDQRCLAALQHRAALTRRLLPGSSPEARRLHRNPAVRSVRACEVAAGVYEASAVVVDELRVRAVAVRLERSNQVWRVTALEIG